MIVSSLLDIRTVTATYYNHMYTYVCNTTFYQEFQKFALGYLGYAWFTYLKFLVKSIMYIHVKLRYCEKATNFLKISHLF